MDQALDADAAWEAIHGPHAVPKKYVPPFLNKQEERKDEEIDRLYELEIERKFATSGKDSKGNNKRRNIDTGSSSDEDAVSKATGDIREQVSGTNGHVSEMKFIKVKINTLKIENEELLHSLLDQTFTLTLEVPLPDIY